MYTENKAFVGGVACFMDLGGWSGGVHEMVANGTRRPPFQDGRRVGL